MPGPESAMTRREVADQLGVSPWTVTRWEREGRIKGFRTLGGHRRFTAADLAIAVGKAADTVLPPDPPPPAPPRGDVRGAVRLTARHVEILQLLADDVPSPEIAARLYLSPHTVKTHIGKIYRTLGVHSQSGAVAVALRAGLIR